MARTHRARNRLVPALYQMHSNDDSVTVVIKQFMEEQDFKKVDIAFFERALHYIAANRTALEALIDPHLSREKGSLGAVEYAVLMVAAYELSECVETPFKVVINEAVLLTAEFGAEGGHSFVNGVLKAMATETRPNELGASSTSSL